MWKAILLLVYVRQGKELNCGFIGYEMGDSDVLDLSAQYAENRGRKCIIG